MVFIKHKKYILVASLFLAAMVINCTHTNVLQGRVMPSYTITPSLNELLDIIRSVEKAYPDDDWKTTAVRLRKTHYNSTLWSLVLLESIEVKPADASFGVPAHYIERLKRGEVEFIDPQGNPVDMGHIWALVNALSQRDLDFAVEELTGLSVEDAISWAGDIGSALAAYGLQPKEDKTSLAQNFKNLAGESDLYGDIDGFGVYSQDVDDHWPLSQRIEYFYTNNLDNRFEYFARDSHLTLENTNGKFSVSNESINKVIVPQVKEFTLFWILHICKINKLKCLAEDIEGTIYTENDVQQTVQLYVDWLENAQNKIN